MSESNRRPICRLLFLGVAIVPCVAVLAAAVWRKSSWVEQSWRAALLSEFGVDVAWDAIAYPAPGEVRWENLRLHDHETGALFAAIDACAMTEQQGRVRFAPNVIEVQAARADSLTSLLRRCFTSGDQVLDLAECEVRLLDDDRRIAATWKILRAESWNTDAGQKSVVRCQPAGGAEIALHIERYAETGAWQLTLDTEDRHLPLAALVPLLPRLAALGGSATFQGAIQLIRESNGWDAQLHGLVNHIDLATLINPHTKHHLTGDAAVRIHSGRFEHGKIVQAACLFGAEDGQINLGLVSDLSGGFFFESTIPAERLISERAEIVPYGELKARFDIHEGGLFLTGLCEPGKALLVDDQSAPLLKPTQKLRGLPLVSALQLLYPTSNAKLAVSRESLWLASFLHAPRANELSDYTSTSAVKSPPSRAADRVTHRENALRSRPPE